MAGRLVIHTNFTARPAVVHDIPLAEHGNPRNVKTVRRVFFEPGKLEPGVTRQTITTEAASHLAEIAQSMRARAVDPVRVARFLDHIVFCLFAEDGGRGRCSSATATPETHRFASPTSRDGFALFPEITSSLPTWRQ